MNKKTEDGSDYRTLGRLFNKRQHAVDTWEKKPSRTNLFNVFKWVSLLSKHTREMDEKCK